MTTTMKIDDVDDDSDDEGDLEQIIGLVDPLGNDTDI